MEYYKDNSTEFEYESLLITKNEQHHCHNRIEIIKVTKGRVRMCLDMAKAVYDAYEGDYITVKSSDIHRISPGGPVSAEIIHFPLSFRPMLASYIRQSFIIPEKAVSENHITKNLLESIFDALRDEYKSKAVSEITSSLCSSLCAVLVDLYPKRRTVVSISRDGTEKSHMYETVSFETIEKFDAALSYITKNFCDSGIKLSTLSEISGINKTYLSSLFPRLTGKHFTDYIHDLRINHAITLMCSTEKNISEIALSCGFETIRSFNNVFKSVIGTTPSGFLSSLSGKSGKGIDTVILGPGSDIF